MLLHDEISNFESISNFSEPVSRPLQLGEMIALLKLAANHGYAVKTAKNVKSAHDQILSDIYTIWFAIENEIDVFSHNVSQLIELVGWKRSELCNLELVTNESAVNM